MIQMVPNEKYQCRPCSQVAIGTACEQAGYDYYLPNELLDSINDSEDGYLTLRDMNRFVRALLPVKKRINYKRGQRPYLNQVKPCKAIVCVLGHYLYMDYNKYYSFFDNEHDEVVTIWVLKD